MKSSVCLCESSATDLILRKKPEPTVVNKDHRLQLRPGRVEGPPRSPARASTAQVCPKAANVQITCVAATLPFSPNGASVWIRKGYFSSQTILLPIYLENHSNVKGPECEHRPLELCITQSAELGMLFLLWQDLIRTFTSVDSTITTSHPDKSVSHTKHILSWLSL